MFLGFYHDSEIPFKAGQVVTLPKGTLVQTRLGLVENKRARRVKIDHILNGMSICVGHVYGGGTYFTLGSMTPKEYRAKRAGGWDPRKEFPLASEVGQ
jgi:hypothetical protein